MIFRQKIEGNQCNQTVSNKEKIQHVNGHRILSMDIKMNAEIVKWKNLRNQADAVIKQTLTAKQESQNGLRIAKALVVYVKTDHTIKTLQMNQKGASKSGN